MEETITFEPGEIYREIPLLSEGKEKERFRVMSGRASRERTPLAALKATARRKDETEESACR